MESYYVQPHFISSDHRQHCAVFQLLVAAKETPARAIKNNISNALKEEDDDFELTLEIVKEMSEQLGYSINNLPKNFLENFFKSMITLSHSNGIQPQYSCKQKTI